MPFINCSLNYHSNRFLQVANYAMCGPIRSLTLDKGHDVAKHHLSSFGGVGGQHSCAIASALGIKRVLIHKYSSILSAYGIGLADVYMKKSESALRPLMILPFISSMIR